MSYLLYRITQRPSCLTPSRYGGSFVNGAPDFVRSRIVCSVSASPEIARENNGSPGGTRSSFALGNNACANARNDLSNSGLPQHASANNKAPVERLKRSGFKSS